VGDQGTTGDNVELGGVLEVGASRAWIIPSVVRTVENIVDDLKGSGGVLLIDGIQVGPGGNREGR